MSWTVELGILMVSLLGLLVAGMWAPFAIGVLGALYLYVQMGTSGLKALGLVAWGSVNSFTLAAVPLFILMAELLLKSGVANRVYRGITPLASRLPGGLLQTNILGCGIFSAISGSSTATAAAIGTVSAPQLNAQGYGSSFSAGSLAAGGTLGILIPPSIPLIIYSSFSEINAATLFMAGVGPGIVLVLLFCIYLALASALLPGTTPARPKEPMPIDMKAVANDLFPFLILILLVLGSIYSGIATPTEAAAVGCIGATLIGYFWGHLGWTEFRLATRSTVRVTGAIMLIVLMAFIFSYAVAITGLPRQLAEWIAAQHMSAVALIVFLSAVYLVLGAIIDSIGMMVITVPLFLPLVTAIGIDPILFGIMVVLFIEIGLITPPVGLNLFVINGLMPEWKMSTVIKGALPFVVLMFLLLAILWNFPWIALWLPSGM